jgi:hypothetical protein
MNNNIEKLVDDTLGSLEGLQRAEANPFLYTRIAQKMKNRQEPPAYQRKLLPALAVALVLFISLNVASYFRMNTADAGSAYKSSGSDIENFANEYNLSEETGI